MRFLVPLTAALVPLLITPGLVSHFDVTPKIAVLLLGTALLLSYRRANVQNVYNLLQQPLGTWFGGTLGAAWVFTALATLLSTHPWVSLDGSGWRRMGLISETGLLLFTLLAAGWLADAGNLKILLRACVAGGALSAAYGIAQYFGWDPWLPVTAYQVGEGQFTIVRPPGTLGHADYFAAWLVAIVFLGLALERIETRRMWKLSAVAAAVLAALAIVLSGTRSAILGVVAGGLAFIILSRPGMRRIAIVAAVAAAVLAVLFLSPAGLKLKARVHWSLEDTAGGARLLLWRDSVRMAARRPISGYGPETFATEFPHFQSVELARALPDFYQESPHNMFLDALISEGLAGFFVLLSLCGLGVWCVVRAARSGQPMPGSLAAALLGLLVAQQFIVFILPTLMYFYLLVAMLVTSTALKPEATKFKGSAVLLVAIIGMTLLLAGYTVRLLIADRFLQEAESAAAMGDVRAAAESYRTLLEWQLPGSSDDLAYSRAMQRLSTGSHDVLTMTLARREALEAATRAVTAAEDRQNAWYNLATLRAGLNDVSGVEYALRQAIQCAPNWFKPHWALAQLLGMTNHPHEALIEAARAAELDANRDAQVTATWKSLQEKLKQGP